MDNICGNVFASNSNKVFYLKCLYCEKMEKEWQDFISHIQNKHGAEEEMDMWVDTLPEESINCKVDILIERLKDDDHDGGIEERAEVSETSLHMAKSDCCDADVVLPTEVGSEEDGQRSDDAVVEMGKANDAEQESAKLCFQFDISFRKRSQTSIAFINLYKSLPCLWNPNDKDYNKPHLKTDAKEHIINTMRDKHHVFLSERSLKVAIKKLGEQYCKAVKAKKLGRKMLPVMLEYLEMCLFLDVEESDLEPPDMDTKNGNSLVFRRMSDVTLAFIDTYARFPALYNSSHDEYMNVTQRKQAYEEMQTILNSEHGISFTEEEIYKSIYCLRHWYYKAKERDNKSSQPLSEAQKIYMEKCSFLPPKRMNKKVVCEVCGKSFQNDTTLQVHLYKEHKIGGWPFKCSNCERSFEHKYSLQLHQQRSHQGKIHDCPHCERRFAVTVDLQRHIQTHTGEKPFICEICGRAFRSKIQLGYHSDAIHTKTRAFKCNMCPKDFLKRRDLTDHIKAHLNIRDKICETCGKGFTNCHSLIRHRQIHSEIKKFKCKLCDAKFHQFVGLNAHMKRTHQIVKNQV